MAINEFKQERIDFAKFHKTAEKQLLPFFKKALANNLGNVTAWVETNGLIGVPVSMLIDQAVWREVYPKVYQLIGMKMCRQEYYRQRRLEGAAETKASAIEFLVDVWSGKMREYAGEYVNFIESKLNATTIEIIERALGEAGSLELDAKGRLRFFYDKIKSDFLSRSKNISRTETTRIAALGKEIGATSWIEEQGQGGYRAWLGRVSGERPTHLATNNTVIQLDGFYTVGGHQCKRPGDSSLPIEEVANCRCCETFMSGRRYDQYLKRGRIAGGKITGAS